VGCSGRILLRCLAGGADRVIGVELSDEARGRGARAIGPNSYRERTGLFLLNLTDREVESLFYAFKVDLKVRIRPRPSRFWHRLWRLQKI